MSRIASALRSLPLAVLGSASARLHDLTQADARIRMPLTLNRRIGVVQVAGGVGASVVAASIASIFAHRRTGLVLGVNASAGSHNMLWHAGVGSGDAVVGQAAPATPSETRHATAGLGVAPSGLIGLELRDPSQPTTPAASRTWFDLINPRSRFFDLVITDWGVRGWQIDLSQVAVASHVICVVTRSERHAIEEAAAIVPALLGRADAPRIVFVIVDVGGGARLTPRLGILPHLGVPIMHVPYDAAAGGATPVASEDLSTAARIAHAILAGTILAEAQLTLLPGPARIEARR